MNTSLNPAELGTLERLAREAGPGACLLLVVTAVLILLWRMVGRELLDRVKSIGEQHAQMASDCKAAAIISRESANAIGAAQVQALAVSKSQERVLEHAEKLIEKIMVAER